MTGKEQLRREIAAKRKALDPAWAGQASERVAGNLRRMAGFLEARTVALYLALPGEVDLGTLFDECWKAGKRTCIPVYQAHTNSYLFAEIKSETRFITGNYNIREPESPDLIPLEEIDFIAVPGVAYDRNGNRLGRGGGYYDRILATFAGTTAGIAFEFQLADSVPCDAHDKPVEYIVTDTEIANVCNER